MVSLGPRVGDKDLELGTSEGVWGGGWLLGSQVLPHWALQEVQFGLLQNIEINPMFIYWKD